MKSLEFSKLKKIAADDKTTTFRHPYGHEVKIVHGKLSKEMRAKLDKLPMHGGNPQKMASGGEPDPDDDQDDSSQFQVEPIDADRTPDSVDDDADAGDQSDDAGPTAPGTSVVGATAPAAQAATPVGNGIPDQSAQPVTSPGASQQPASAPAQNEATPQDAPLTPEQVYSDHMQNTANEMSSFQNDLQAGKITPKTYSDLYASKSTLGKMGLIFGALVGGAGSGLSHQPNLLLSMMNDQINRDLDAQKTGNANAQNWYHLAQQQQIAHAQQGLLDAQTGSQKAEAKVRLANAQLTGTENAKSLMQYAFLHHAAQLAGAIPPTSPSKAAAQQVLGTLGAAVNQDVQTRNHQVASQMAQQVPALGQIDTQGISNLETRANVGDPTVSSNDVNSANTEAGEVEQTETSRQNFMNSFDHLNNMVLAGKLSPQQQKAYTAQMAQDIAAGNPHIGMDRAQAALQGFMPSGKDLPGSNTRAVKLDQANRFFNEMDAKTPTLDRFHLRNRDAGAQGGSQQASQAPQSKSGRSMIQKNGKWYYND